MKQIPRLLRVPPPAVEGVALNLITAEFAQRLAEPVDPEAPVEEAEAGAVVAIIDVLRRRVAKIEAET